MVRIRGQEKVTCRLGDSQTESVTSPLLSLRSLQALEGLRRAQPRRGGELGFAQPVFQVFISPRNSLSDTPTWKSVQPGTWAPRSPAS